MISHIIARPVEYHTHPGAEKAPDRRTALGAARERAFAWPVQKLELAAVVAVVLIDWHCWSLPRSILQPYDAELNRQLSADWAGAKQTPEASAPRGVVGPVFRCFGILDLLEEYVTSDHSSDRAELHPVV